MIHGAPVACARSAVPICSMRVEPESANAKAMP